MKEMIIDVIPTIPESTYVVGTIVIVIFYLSFYGIYGLLVLIQYCRGENAYDRMQETTSDGSVARNQSINGDGDSSRTNEGDNTEIPISVALLSKTPNEEQTEKYKLYCLNLIPIAIFYALPVIQLVLAYQHIYHDNGDEDICYYNFLCANSLGVLSSFNNVFSNIGYVLLGILFLIITRREENMHQALSPEITNKLGLPRYFGIFYAIGIALIMEGIHSACYHVCPTHGNFQFDTSYMYIMVSLSMLKLYQGRHPDVTSSSHVSYICLALVIFVTVIGVVFDTVWFWVIFTILHILVTFGLTAQIYSIKGISRDRLKESSSQECSKPSYPARIVLLVVGNVINLSFALYGAITQPRNFASHLLYVFLANSAWYMVYYITMKCIWGERIFPKAPRAVVFLVLNAVWGPALYFFVQGLAQWDKTPAESREGNRECLLFDFYDDHDVLHMLSACGLFFTFMTLLTLDDDIDYNKPRGEIPAF